MPAESTRYPMIIDFDGGKGYLHPEGPGLLIGMVVSLTSLVAPPMANISMFVVMALVLLLRPSGLFGRAGLMG